MTFEQSSIFVIFLFLFGFLIWGKIRYDVIAFFALIIGTLLGVVPISEVFMGFSHPATILVALVLLVSAGMVNSGVVYLITNSAFNVSRSIGKHIAIIASVGALLSSFINNIAALALLMPIDLQVAKKMKRNAGKTLMPLSFATILGGMVTLIGTPPNIIISAIRQKNLGEPFNFFDFTPVGILVCLAGLIFIITFGWKLMAKKADPNGEKNNSEIGETYFSELVVSEKSKYVGEPISELKRAVEEFGSSFIKADSNHEIVKAGEKITVHTSPETLDEIRITLGLNVENFGKLAPLEQNDNLEVFEVLITEMSRLNGKTVDSVGLFWRQQTTLLGISRSGRALKEGIKKTKIKEGDILLLLAAKESHDEVVAWLDVLTLKDRELNFTRHGKAWIALLSFIAAVSIPSIGIISLEISLSLLVCFYLFTNILSINGLYGNIAWPIIILLASMIPLGYALEKTGGTDLIVTFMIENSTNLPTWALLSVLMLVTMTLSDILNNTATTIVAAPIAINLAYQLEVNPDPFLMGIAVAASCAFLTPIGHKNNTLIMGPGGYNFFDYWRMGLPLQLIVLVISIPAIVFFWPF